MVPGELKAASFVRYPPQARALAVEHLELLRELPLLLVPLLLRELNGYDWKFPAERRELRKQLGFLAGMSWAKRAAVLEGFRAISLKPELAGVDWVNDPPAFLEQLTAWLWSTHQMDRFRGVADGYAAAVNASAPEEQPAMPRLGVVAIGAGAERGGAPLFRKLRPAGVHLTRVKPEDGMAILLAEGSRRAARSSADAEFRHWYIDGGAAGRLPDVTQVSYAGLEEPRARLLGRIEEAIGSGHMGPEELRSLLARMKPGDVGLSESGSDRVLNQFQLSLLTEGAGTQIFSTTFVQWAARECVRRAQPETLMVRYAPRQQAQTLNTMLSGAKVLGVDAAGSLVDADMGAYYTWLNLRRLAGAEQLRFVAWFEGRSEAVVIGPGLPQGSSSDSPMDMHQVLALLG